MVRHLGDMEQQYHSFSCVSGPLLNANPTFTLLLALFWSPSSQRATAETGFVTGCVLSHYMKSSDPALI